MVLVLVLVMGKKLQIWWFISDELQFDKADTPSPHTPTSNSVLAEGYHILVLVMVLVLVLVLVMGKKLQIWWLISDELQFDKADTPSPHTPTSNSVLAEGYHILVLVMVLVLVLVLVMGKKLQIWWLISDELQFDKADTPTPHTPASNSVLAEGHHGDA